MSGQRRATVAEVRRVLAGTPTFEARSYGWSCAGPHGCGALIPKPEGREAHLRFHRAVALAVAALDEQ